MNKLEKGDAIRIYEDGQFHYHKIINVSNDTITYNWHPFKRISHIKRDTKMVRDESFFDEIDTDTFMNTIRGCNAKIIRRRAFRDYTEPKLTTLYAFENNEGHIVFHWNIEQLNLIRTPHFDLEHY